VIFLTVMTTTLINLSTPNPLAVMFIRLRISDINTITASKQLKKSKKNMPLDAKTLKQISIKKNDRKT
jgi:hypothetical protein